MRLYRRRFLRVGFLSLQLIQDGFQGFDDFVGFDVGLVDADAPFVPWAVIYAGMGPRIAYLTTTCALPVIAGFTILQWSSASETNSALQYQCLVTAIGYTGWLMVIFMAYRLSKLGKDLSESASAARHVGAGAD